MTTTGTRVRNGTAFAVATVAGFAALSTGSMALAQGKSLEDRAEALEKSTAKRGDGKVSLQVSGHVNRAILSFDDGERSEVTHGDNSHSNSRFRFDGINTVLAGGRVRFQRRFQPPGSAAMPGAETQDAGTEYR